MFDHDKNVGEVLNAHPARAEFRPERRVLRIVRLFRLFLRVEVVEPMNGCASRLSVSAAPLVEALRSP